MKKSKVSVFIVTGLLSVLLSGCLTDGRHGEGMTGHRSEPVMNAEEERTGEQEDTEGNGNTGEDEITEENENTKTEKQISLLPYQFARQYGIIQSEYPVYELDTVVEWETPQKEKTISLTSAIHQKQELLISVVLDDYSKVQKIPAGGDPPAKGQYDRLSDGSMITSERYQDEQWKTGEGLILTGPGIPESGIEPLKSMCAGYPAYFEAYGHRRYILEARFELPSAPGPGDHLSGYGLRLSDFEKPLEFTLKRVPEYGTLEELADQEHGTIDSHDGISIICMGEKVKEGILVSWYVYSEEKERTISVIYKPSYQEIDLPVIWGNGKQYAIRQMSANPYWDNLGHDRLWDIKQFGRRTRCLFDVLQEEQNGSFQIRIPGITFLNHEESPPVTLPIPEDYEELKVDIPWKDGTVRILDIIRMKEPHKEEIKDEQGNMSVRERPAVYIHVAAVHAHKDLALKSLICQRKLRWTGWEHERYDFDDKGNLKGFRIFYDEGDTEVTLKFHGAAFYWNQPYVMGLSLRDDSSAGHGNFSGSE